MPGDAISCGLGRGQNRALLQPFLVELERDPARRRCSSQPEPSWTAERGQPQSLERILRPRPSSMTSQPAYFRPRDPRGPDSGVHGMLGRASGAAGISSAWTFEPALVLGRGPAPLAPSTPGTCAGPRPGSPRCGTGAQEAIAGLFPLPAWGAPMPGRRSCPGRQRPGNAVLFAFGTVALRSGCSPHRGASQVGLGGVRMITAGIAARVT
jgi:hypothetical protein